MNCMSLACKANPKKATTGFSYERKGKGKYFLACDECSKAWGEKLKARGLEYLSGPVCPFCSGSGTNKAFLHVQGGVCFRCQGKGHW